LQGHGSEDLALQLRLGTFTLTGRITLSDGALLQVRYTGSVKARDLLTAWIGLLAASAQTGRELKSFVLSRSPAYVLLSAPADPPAVLESLLGLRWEGLRRPLCLLPETSLAYAGAIVGGRTPEQASKEAMRKWSSPFDHAREGERIASRICFPEIVFDEAFRGRALEVWGPILAAMQELKS
jgi:exodeoxyribonuclease V gamma subunit